MGEEFIKEGEYKEHKFKIYLLKEFDKHICSVYVMPNSLEFTLFNERTIISHEAKMIGKSIIKQQLPGVKNYDKFLIKKFIFYTSKNAKDRFNRGDFEKGKTYDEEISLENIKQWIEKIKI